MNAYTFRRRRLERGHRRTGVHSSLVVSSPPQVGVDTGGLLLGRGELVAVVPDDERIVQAGAALAARRAALL